VDGTSPDESVAVIIPGGDAPGGERRRRSTVEFVRTMFFRNPCDLPVFCRAIIGALSPSS
jgi:hypothetical protein